MSKRKRLKIFKIEFANHVVLENMVCQFSDTYTEIIGLNGTGKSSIIDSVWQAFEGIAEKGPSSFRGERFRFIRPGAKSAAIKLTLIDAAYDNAEIIVERKFTKSSNAKLSFKAPDGYPISHEWLSELFSVAFFSPSTFTALTAKEQALLLGIDTSEFDEKKKSLKKKYSEINARLKALGKPEEFEKVEKVDVDSLVEKKIEIDNAIKSERQKISDRNEEKRKLYEEQLREAKEIEKLFRDKQDSNRILIADAKDCLEDLRKLGYTGEEVQAWIDSLPKPEKEYVGKEIQTPTYEDPEPDKTALTEIDRQIASASETNVKAAAYERYLEKLEKIESVKKELTENKTLQSELESERTDFLKKSKLPFKGMTIDDNGGLLFGYQGEAPREIRPPYFSQGQLMKIVPQLLASRNPEMELVFLDDFDLFDDENQKKIPEMLIKKGFQVIVAKVGRSKPGENIITLSPIEDDREEGEELA